MKLQSDSVHPHGLSDADFDALFTRDTHVVMAFHGYAPLVHQLTHRRANRRIHVHGYREECNFTTPFDIRVQNQMDRFHLVQKVLSCLPDQGSPGSYLRQFTQDKLIEHTRHIRQHGQDLPEIRDWQWRAPHAGTGG